MSEIDLPSSSPPAYRFQPRAPGWTQPFLLRLAEELRARPAGEALLFERVGDGLPTVVASVPSLGLAIRDASDGLPGSLQTLRSLPGAPEVALGRGRFVLLWPTGEPPGADADVGRTSLAGSPGLPGPGPRPSPVGTLFPEESTRSGAADPGCAVQCHWWSTGSSWLAVRVRQHVSADPSIAPSTASPSSSDLVRPLVESGYSVGVRTVRASWGRRRAWMRGTVSGLEAGRPFLLAPLSAARLAVAPSVALPIDEAVLDRHAVVVGASGSGKSSFLAELARRRISGGRPTVVFDVHGDLGPAILAGLSPAAAERVLAIDVTRPAREIPGVPLFSGITEEEREREAAHLVASFRHVSSEGSETYWGHRLEQLFDVFVRLVEEEGGGFGDLFDLLTDPRRQDAARYST
ncbi:MAG TPA: DUF87 domain-containing protein, partial [Thermoplasmata archaeon]|nr:DUF87 domain-containing protein [Thermoplasmata archaeon]